MFSVRVSRLVRRFISHYIFTLATFFIIFLLSAGLARYYQHRQINQSALVSPVADQTLTVNLITLATPVASTSADVESEYFALQQMPFQVMTLDPSGNLSELPLSASMSAQAQILVNKSLPGTESTKKLYDYWQRLSQTATPFNYLWLSDSHIGILFPGPLLTLFSVETSASSGLDTLQQIRSRSTINLIGTLIDLRFDKPIVTEQKISIK